MSFLPQIQEYGYTKQAQRCHTSIKRSIVFMDKIAEPDNLGYNPLEMRYYTGMDPAGTAGKCIILSLPE